MDNMNPFVIPPTQDIVVKDDKHKLDRTVFQKGVKLPTETTASDMTAMVVQAERNPKKIPAKSKKETETYDAEVVTDYRSDYMETEMMLKSAIAQTDTLMNDINSDLKTIRSSKAMTNKYRYITDLTSSMSALISTKISAAKELNNSVTHAIDFNMKHQKEIKAQLQAAAQDDDKRIMDMYSAYMSVPMGTYQPPQGQIPNMRELTFGAQAPGEIPRIDVGTPAEVDAGYQSYLNNMTPTQNAMRYENNPDIQTVVVYDQSNGNKWFDVINIKTGESIPNVPRPDEFLLNDTRPDMMNRVARNSNIDKVYPLIIVGQRSSLQDY